jgi:phosphinothricin acetyltransferase
MKLERRGRALRSTPRGRPIPVCRIEHVPPDADPAVLHQSVVQARPRAALDAFKMEAPPMSVTHRIATRNDLAQIVAIYNSTIPTRMVTADTESVSVESRIQWFEEHRPTFRPLWVVGAEGRIAAWLSFSAFYGRPAYDKTAELSVYVNESFRRRGLGAYLLTQAVSHAPVLKVDTLLGFIFGHNEPSLALFERFSFSRWGRLPRVAVLNGVERDLIIVGRRV